MKLVRLWVTKVEIQKNHQNAMVNSILLKMCILCYDLTHFKKFVKSRHVFIYSLIQFKGYSTKFKFFDGLQLRKYFISLLAFHLIIWLMKSPKNFEKTSILKIWWLVFFRGVKTHFGEIPLKLCIFSHEIFYVHQSFPSNSYSSHQM